jgi:CSLREA domain-containing protein/uncharacterized repeat protein (TIGR01451 family)
MTSKVKPLFLLPVLLAMAMASGPVDAATITVDTIEDAVNVNGQCSLRAAIINANQGDQSGSNNCAAGSAGIDTLRFAGALSGQTLVLNGSQLPTITSSVRIEGPVEGDPEALVLDADGQSRLFEASGTISVHLQDLTLTGGHTTAPNGQGAAFKAVDGVDLGLERVHVLANVTARAGGHGGGIYSADGALTIIDSTISGNRATVLVSNGGGVATYNSVVHIERSLFHDNESVNNAAGGLRVEGGQLTLINSTISGNRASSVGGLAISGAEATVLHSTLAFNIGGAGISAQDVSVGGQSSTPAILELINTLIVQADDRTACYRLTNAHTTLTNIGSIATDTSCGGDATQLEWIRLTGLSAQGGLTRTHGLGVGSAAINAAGDCMNDHGLDEDQRGLPRPGGDSLACDVGAFEQQESPPEADLALSAQVLPEQAEVGQTVQFELIVSNLGPDEAPGVAVDVTLPAGFDLESFSSDAGNLDPATGLWQIGDLAVAAEVSLGLTATVTSTHAYRLQAVAGSPAFDPDMDNNFATARLWLPPATLVVTTLADQVLGDGHCSLREAIINANNNDQSGSSDCAAGSDFDRIEFAPDLIGKRIVLDGNVLPTIIHPVYIAGPVRGNPAGIILDGNEHSGILRAMHASKEAWLRLSDLSLTGGRADTGSALLASGSADVRLERVIVHNNRAFDSSILAGAIHATNRARVEIVDSEISNNLAPHSSSRAGGLHLSGNARGLLLRSTVDGNRANQRGGGIYVRDAELLVESSTISGNQGGGQGGAGVFIEGGVLHLRHATVADNVLGAGATTAASIAILGSADYPSHVVLENSIIVQPNTTQPVCSALDDFSVLSHSGSLASDASCTGSATSAEAIGLAPLAYDVGPTRVHALPKHSAARDAAGDCTSWPGLDRDQRNLPRPGLKSEACDVGAYEFQFDSVFADRLQGH